jgi:hypothetical protein
MGKKSETRDVRDFSEVTLRGYGELLVEQGAPERLVIDADDALLARISSEVRGRRLVLGFRMPWYEWLTWWISWLMLPDKRIRYALRAGRVEGLFLTGSGTIRAQGIDGGSLEAGISGSGRIECAGRVQRLEARISGSGGIDTRGLDAVAAVVRISGSGGVTVKASETLDVRISGSGGVRYLGSPRVTTHISGSGGIRQVQGDGE